MAVNIGVIKSDSIKMVYKQTGFNGLDKEPSVNSHFGTIIRVEG